MNRRVSHGLSPPPQRQTIQISAIAVTKPDTAGSPNTVSNNFSTPNATLVASIRLENCSTKWLTGASTWPMDMETPNPNGCATTSVPCATEMMPLRARAAPNVMSERFNPASTWLMANSLVSECHANGITSAARQVSNSFLMYMGCAANITGQCGRSCCLIDLHGNGNP